MDNRADRHKLAQQVYLISSCLDAARGRPCHVSIDRLREFEGEKPLGRKWPIIEFAQSFARNRELAELLV